MDRAAVRVGLIGYGLAGAVFHAPLIASTPRLQLVSVVTGNPDRQAQARREHPGVGILGHVDELWRAAGDHDLVVVATANATHLPLGLAAIQAGLAVVVDKPLALTAAEGRRLVAAARERGVLLTVFHNRRWDGDLRTLRRLLDADTLGPVHRFESRYDRWRPAPRPGAWRELERPEAGGGLLLDLGSHLVDQALLLFGQPRSVYAEADRRRAGVEGDDDVFIALEHPGGVRSHLWASVLAAQVGPRLRVLGARGAYVKHGLDVQEEALRAGRRSRGGAASHGSAGAGWASTATSARSRPSRGRTSSSMPGWPRRSEAAGLPRSIPRMPSPVSGSSTLPARAPPAEQRYGCDRPAVIGSGLHRRSANRSDHLRSPGRQDRRILTPLAFTRTIDPETGRHPNAIRRRVLWV